MLINNRYQVIRPLGEGGFGKTYLVTDTQMPSQRQCVVKQLKPITENSEIYQLVQDRFQREAAILEQLGENHRQIPRLYAYFSEGKEFYLVQEWIDGDPLDTMTVPAHEPQVLSILTSLLPTLSFVHGKGIIHRDIKPDNIILSTGPSGQLPVLIDFGAVRETMGTVLTQSSQPVSSIVIGTPGYMSHEQAAGRPVPSSDLFSLGLTAIYLLTGKPPQELRTDPDTGEFDWVSEAPHVSDRTKAVLSQAVRSHPRDRFSNASAMLKALAPQTPSPDDYPRTPGMPYSAAPTVLPSDVPLSQVKTQAVSPAGQSGSSPDTYRPPATTYPQPRAGQTPTPATGAAGGQPSNAAPDGSYGAQSAGKRFSPLLIALMVFGIGGTAIGAGVMMSRATRDTTVQPLASEPSSRSQSESDANSTGDKADSETADPSSSAPADDDDAEANIPDQPEVTPPPVPEPEPDFPEIPIDNTPGEWKLLTDRGSDRVDIYSYPSYSADTPHYGLGGDRVRELGSRYRSEGILWQRILFESGVDGWVPVVFLQTIPSEPTPVPDPPVSSLPRAGSLGGAPGERINVRSAPSTSASSPHYGLGGDPVTITDQVQGADGNIWYSVTFESGASGWVRGDLVN